MATAPDQRKPPEIASASEHLDRQLVKSAYSKVSRGETPTAQERAALDRYEKEKEERLRWQYYGSIPAETLAGDVGSADQGAQRAGATLRHPVRWSGDQSARGRPALP